MDPSSLSYDPQTQEATDKMQQFLIEGGCASCCVPLFTSIKYTKHQMKLRFRTAGCCCKLFYTCPWCLAFWITRFNKACFVCLYHEQKVLEKKDDIKAMNAEHGAALVCCIQACFLSFFPIACTECICLNLTYYSCCMCLGEISDEDDPKKMSNQQN